MSTYDKYFPAIAALNTHGGSVRDAYYWLARVGDPLSDEVAESKRALQIPRVNLLQTMTTVKVVVP